ncbi:MAG: nucleoside 2-deoxyribosyltransferase [Oscillospiraceae bacterium]
MKKKPVVYIAGFECFLPDGKQRAQRAVEICEELGFVGVSPMIGDGNAPPIDFSKGKKAAAIQIFHNNIGYIDRCDLVIANLNNFRGWELDGGTCFELGYAFSQEKKLYGFMEDTRPCFEKYIGNVYFDQTMWRDECGAFFEAGCCNLMINAPATVVEGDFKAALEKAKSDFGL